MVVIYETLEVHFKPDSDQCDEISQQALIAAAKIRESPDQDSKQQNSNLLSSLFSTPEPIYTGMHFQTYAQVMEECRKFALFNRFIVTANTHPFPNHNPLPIFGENSKPIQRGKIYCNFRDPVVKKETKVVRTTCSWFVSFSYDRGRNDYFIAALRIKHNHQTKIIKARISGGLDQINLATELVESERLNDPFTCKI